MGGAESKPGERILTDSDSELMNRGGSRRKLLALGFVFEHFSHLIKRLLNCAAAGQVFCACLCVKRYMER